MPTFIFSYPAMRTGIITALESLTVYTTVLPYTVITASLGTVNVFSFSPMGSVTLASIPSARDKLFIALIFTGNVLVDISPLGITAMIFPEI